MEVCSTRSYPESMLWNNPFVRYHDQSEGKIAMDIGIKIMGDTVRIRRYADAWFLWPNNKLTPLSAAYSVCAHEQVWRTC